MCTMCDLHLSIFDLQKPLRTLFFFPRNFLVNICSGAKVYIQVKYNNIHNKMKNECVITPLDVYKETGPDIIN